jgi:hypothetical protein
MRIDWAYSEDLHQTATILSLANSFQQTLAEFLNARSIGMAAHAAAEFPELGLSQAELDELLTDTSES